jgi:hypothetical protein
MKNVLFTRQFIQKILLCLSKCIIQMGKIGVSAMDALQASFTIKRILEDTNIFKHKTLCTLIDGDWGIGKTHFIQNYFDQNDYYEAIYVSVFGKESVKEIENTLLINLIPGFKNVNDFGGFAKLLGNFAKDIVDKFAGVNIENYLNSFAIEDIKNSKKDSKKIVICFDDMERKSDSINIKDLLGLIERASINFDVILISNTKEFDEEDLDVFNLYKEKVIDHVIKIDKLSRNILNQILDGVNDLNKDELIDIYIENIIAFGTSSMDKDYLAEKINNLRIFVKYFNLVVRAKEHIGVGNIDKELLRICKAVVYDYYFPLESKKNKQVNFDKFNIYNDLKKLLLFENISDESFKSYISHISEIRQDINTLYNLHRLNDEELSILNNKIDVKIRGNEMGYFIDQSTVISLTSALEENNLLGRKRFKELLKIAIDIYSPKENSTHASFKHTSWNDFDMYGNEIECNKEIKLFIEEVNIRSKEKFSSILNENINNSIRMKDYDRVLMLLNYDDITERSQFEAIFDYYFCKLEIRYSQENQEKIERLVQVTKSDVIGNFFVERASKENSFTNKKKYQYFDNVLEMKMYHQSQIEAQIGYQMNYLED